jgi:hypothetical protein
VSAHPPTHAALIERDASDGRHLGEEGRRWVAAHLLATLAALA